MAASPFMIVLRNRWVGLSICNRGIETLRMMSRTTLQQRARNEPSKHIEIISACCSSMGTLSCSWWALYTAPMFHDLNKLQRKSIKTCKLLSHHIFCIAKNFKENNLSIDLFYVMLGEFSHKCFSSRSTSVFFTSWVVDSCRFSKSTFNWSIVSLFQLLIAFRL